MGICTQYYFYIEIRDNDYVKNVRIHNQSNGHIIFDVTLPTWEAVLKTCKDNLGIAFTIEIEKLIQKDYNAK